MDIEARPAPIRATALPLPFDDEGEQPVPFVLTAAAQRDVLGRVPPPLVAVPPVAASSVVEAPVAELIAPGATDTRRVQARALLRSGMPVLTIAAALGVDVEAAETWTEDLVDELARRRRRPSGRGRPAPIGSGVGVEQVRPPRPSEQQGLLAGLVFALADIHDHGVTIRHDRLEPVGVLFDALREAVPRAVDRTRVALRVGPGLPGDRVRSDVAARLGIDAECIRVGRCTDGVGATLDIRVDVRDGAAAASAIRWRDGTSSGGSGLRGWDSNPQTFRLTADCSAS